MNFENILNKFGTAYEYQEFENLYIGIVKNESDTYNFIQFINGLNSHNGGKPIEWVEDRFINTFKSNMPKKYKDIKAGDIKNKIVIVVIFKHMKNPRFEDQIKSICGNSYTQFKDIVQDVDFDELAKKVFKNKDIKQNILDYYDMKADFLAKKELKNLVKVKNEDELLTERYLPATREKKYLVISEGTSAKNSQIKALGNYEFGFFEGTGVPANVLEIDLKRFKENKRGMPELYKIISTEDYEYILLGSDSDADGSHINGLWLAFMFKYFPEKLKANKVGMLKTPLIVVRNKKDEIVATLYDFEEIRIWESNNDSSKYDMDYKKGYGSLRGPDEMIEFVERDGLDKIIDIIKWSDDDEQLIYNWLGKDNADIRKQMLLSNEFDLNKVV